MRQLGFLPRQAMTRAIDAARRWKGKNIEVCGASTSGLGLRLIVPLTTSSCFMLSIPYDLLLPPTEAADQHQYGDLSSPPLYQFHGLLTLDGPFETKAEPCKVYMILGYNDTFVFVLVKNSRKLKSFDMVTFFKRN